MTSTLCPPPLTQSPLLRVPPSRTAEPVGDTLQTRMMKMFNTARTLALTWVCFVCLFFEISDRMMCFVVYLGLSFILMIHLCLVDFMAVCSFAFLPLLRWCFLGLVASFLC
eukprot:m.175557 g.175557  ORF g.175557 m.175557 type:complete len:111 (+) comp53320_c1_seq1:738-1070(+)